MDKAGELRGRILELVAEYFSEAFPATAFVPGVTPIPVAGRVFDQSELQSLTDSALDFWLTAGRFAEQPRRCCCSAGRLKGDVRHDRSALGLAPPSPVAPLAPSPSLAPLVRTAPGA